MDDHPAVRQLNRRVGLDEPDLVVPQPDLGVGTEQADAVVGDVKHVLAVGAREVTAEVTGLPLRAGRTGGTARADTTGRTSRAGRTHGTGRTHSTGRAGRTRRTGG